VRAPSWPTDFRSGFLRCSSLASRRNQISTLPLEVTFEDRSMTKGDELRYGAVRNAVHLCVDMQRMFSGGTDWAMPWLPRVLPNLVAIASAHPERTIFTRFIPAHSQGQGAGMWRRYYERWSSMTIDKLGPEMVDLVPELARFVPPARTFDKYVYSPWTGSGLHAQLREADVETTSSQAAKPTSAS
jgi:isochorismatase family protein